MGVAMPMPKRCDEPFCYGPATVEIVALWRQWEVYPSRDTEDTVTVVGFACDDDRASQLTACRQWGVTRGYRHPVSGQVEKAPGVYARFIESSSRIME